MTYLVLELPKHKMNLVKKTETIIHEDDDDCDCDGDDEAERWNYRIIIRMQSLWKKQEN